MGIFRPIVERAQSTNRVDDIDHSNDKPFTPIDAISLTRPLYFGPKIARMLLDGERNVTPRMMAMAATDMEGIPARYVDTHRPGSGLGSTEHGQAVDTYCDTSGLIIVAGAALRAPRVSLGAKVAIGEVLGQEGFKAIWAASRALKYKQRTGEKLSLPPTYEGKEAIVEKLMAVTCAVATNDVDPGPARKALTAGALYFATTGAVRGERARQGYEDTIQEIFSNLPPQIELHPLEQTVDLPGGHWQVIAEPVVPASPISANATRRGIEGSYR